MPESETGVMRLYLSSYQLGDHPERFVDLVGGARRGWVIMNALDAFDEEFRRTDVSRQIEQLATIGLHAEDLDLRRHRPESIEDAFGEPDFLWVRGGNVFVLRMAMAASGLDQVIIDGLHDDRFVHAGFSAGACVLAPSLAGLELCDPVGEAQRTYGDVRFDALGILDRPVVPHLDSPDHPESELLGRVAAEYVAQGQPFWALRDGQAMVVDGAEPMII